MRILTALSTYVLGTVTLYAIAIPIARSSVGLAILVWLLLFTFYVLIIGWLLHPHETNTRRHHLVTHVPAPLAPGAECGDRGPAPDVKRHRVVLLDPPARSDSAADGVAAAATSPDQRSQPAPTPTRVGPQTRLYSVILYNTDNAPCAMQVPEAEMIPLLRELQTKYLALPQRPRMQIRPVFDARLHNSTERLNHRPGWRERVFVLPPGMAHQVIGLRC